MKSITVNSPAKVNLFLRLLNKRADGYHELASLFQAVDLMDILHISLSTKDQLSCSDPAIPVDESNLVLKAAHLFRCKTGLGFGIQVHLDKKIPHQAGLGGGSSNAASTLWALNELTGKVATPEDLIAWSSEIGSDVPFFFSQGRAYCTGRGEKLSLQSTSTPQKYWIVKPERGTSTKEVYKRVDLAKLSKRDPLVALDSFSTPDPHYFNDLETAAFEILPELETIKKELLSCFETVLLSGSGSSFICVGESKPPATFKTYQVNPVSRPLNGWY